MNIPRCRGIIVVIELGQTEGSIYVDVIVDGSLLEDEQNFSHFLLYCVFETLLK